MKRREFLAAGFAASISSAAVALAEHVAGKNIVTEVSMAKWWITELLKRTCDEVLQFHGGYGYMMEYPIARAYVDSRIQTIYGGTTEIQKEIIGRSLGL